MDMRNWQKKALVLSGGGAKGCYEIGAWKFFEENKIYFDVVVGASVGALNAAFVANKDFKVAQDVWAKIQLTDIVYLPPELIKDGKFVFKGKISKNLNILRNALVDLRLDTAPLKKLIETYVNEKKIRNSGVELGIVAYNVSDLNAEMPFLSEIPMGSLPDYLLASASFPAFSPAKINGKKFIDGGVHDNMPFQMVKERGYKDIVVIDITGLGINRRPNITGTRTLYIKNSMEFGTVKDVWGILKFEKKFLEDFTQLGYLDTGKAMGRFIGTRYFFDFGYEYLQSHERILLSNEAKKTILEKYLYLLNRKQQQLLHESSFKNFLESLLPKKLQKSISISLSYIEMIFFALGLDVLKSWEARDMWIAVQEQFAKISEETNQKNPMAKNLKLKYFLTDIEARTQRRVLDPNTCPAPYEYYVWEDKQDTDHVVKSVVAKKKIVQRFHLLPAIIGLDLFCGLEISVLPKKKSTDL